MVDKTRYYFTRAMAPKSVVLETALYHLNCRAIEPCGLEFDSYDRDEDCPACGNEAVVRGITLVPQPAPVSKDK